VIPANNSKKSLFTVSGRMPWKTTGPTWRINVLNSVDFQLSVSAAGLGIQANSLGIDLLRATSLCESKVTSVADNLLTTE